MKSRHLLLLKKILFVFGILLVAGCTTQRTITSTPSDASVRGRHYMGSELLTGPKWWYIENIPNTPSTYTYEGINHVKLSKEGYEDTDWINLYGKRQIHVTLKPKKRDLTEEVFSVPSGASVYFGDSKYKQETMIGTTPLRNVQHDYKLDAGCYRISLHGYEDVVKCYEESSSSRKFKVSLSEKEETEIYEEIISTPSGAEIFWGESPGNITFSGYKTPHKFTYKSKYPSIPKKYVLLKKDGYMDTEPELYKEVNEARTISLKLEKEKYGAIRLESNQKSVDIYIDGKLRGQIGEKPFVTKLPVGSHTIMAKKDFFGSKTINVKIELYDSVVYTFELVKSGNFKEQIGTGKIIQSTGKLILFTGRNDLTVLIDGIKYTPPTTIPQMASGRYTAVLLSDGISKRIEFVVKEGGKTIVDLDSEM